MQFIMTIFEYLFAIVLAFIILIWVLICMFAELPGLPRYLRIKRM
jgi:hypothetical protein